MPDRSAYQPLPQSADDELESDTEGLPSPVTNPTDRLRTHRRMSASRPIDLRKLDAAFKRYVLIILSMYTSEQHPDGQNLLHKK